MTLLELEKKIARLRSAPLLIMCRTPQGIDRVMTVEECIETGSVFLHIVADDIDAILAAEFPGRDETAFLEK